MEKLIAYLLQFGTLNHREIKLISERAMETELLKDAYLAEAGKVFNQVVFVLEGVFRICYYNDKGDEVTKYFVDENHMVANPYQDEQFTEYVQAITDCRLLVFSKEQWKELSETIPGWDSMINKIFQSALMEKVDRRSALVSEDATTRYLTFLEKFPALVNRVPLSYVASYLGITQQSLSRIRKNVH